MSKIPFTVSARTARLIGQENFANAEGAIIELVKNSYDADSSNCLVIINPLSDSIYIIDNGEGMEENTIKKYWMTIGTDIKKNEFKSKNGRTKTGAKGIGRFALDRLGHQCQMLTRAADKSCLEWNVWWDQFDVKDAVIEDIKAELIQKEKFSIKEEVENILKLFDLKREIISNWGDNKGTIIKISQLKDEWSDSQIASLYNNLEELVPPLEESSFNLYLYNSIKPEDFGKVYSALCDDYDYKFSAIVNYDSKVELNLFRNELQLEELEKLKLFDDSNISKELYSLKTFKDGLHLTKELKELMPGINEKESKEFMSTIGTFTFDFFFLKRGGGQERSEGIGKFPYKVVQYRDRAKWLDKFGGIKIYRDNFRVRPYGETDSNSFDWLDLGKRALSNPTVTRPGYKVRPQQVYGIINISRISNSIFDDKSGREGLQENNYFKFLKQIVIALIEFFENDRNQVMMALKKINDKLFEKEKSKEKADEIIKNKKKNKKNSSSDPDTEVLIKAIEAYKEDLEDLFEQEKLLRVLASTGLIVTSFAHEFKNHTDHLLTRVDEFKNLMNDVIDPRKLKGIPDYLDPYIMLGDMQKEDERLKVWLDFSLASVRKDKRKRTTINMVEYIDSMERMWISLLSRRKIELKMNRGNFLEVFFKGFEIDLDSIFNNLLANSVDAFKRPDAGDTRKITISFSIDPIGSSGINVEYEDSGPGLEKEIIDPNQIFQPFFTTKRDKDTGEKIGTGLGMWIVRATIDEYNGKIEILRSRPGFKLKLTLPYN